VILAGRRINDGMGVYVAGQMVKAMLRRRIQVDSARVLILGLTFKENCPDLRNTRVIDIVAELRDFGVLVDVHDPRADPKQALLDYGLELVANPQNSSYDGIIIAVAHEEFREELAGAIPNLGKAVNVIYDLKNVLPESVSSIRL
jgi:UDP-N-acetyl-D-galactosamine dehydrogenase